MALRAYVFFYVFLKGTSHFLFGFAQTLPLLHCLLLHVPVCDSFGIVAITVGFAFGSSLYILQHARQHPTHNKCIIFDRVGVEQSKGHQRRERTLESRKEVKKDFVDRIAHSKVAVTPAAGQ